MTNTSAVTTTEGTEIHLIETWNVALQNVMYGKAEEGGVYQLTGDGTWLLIDGEPVSEAELAENAAAIQATETTEPDEKPEPVQPEADDEPVEPETPAPDAA